MTKKRGKKPRQQKQPVTADYENLRQIAYDLIVVQGKTQKFTSDKLAVSENTVSKWSTEGKWKDMRAARMQTASSQEDNLRNLINLLAKQRLGIETLISEAIQKADTNLETNLRRQAAGISDEISKLNKTLQNFNKATYTLGSYIDVMDDIFSALRLYDELLWESTLDFQTQHIRKVTTELN